MSRLSAGVVLYDASGNAVSIINDGGVYRISGLNKILNSGGSQINPSTEETLSAADTKLGTIDAALDSIKDTDGVKKINDALPVGDNIIGRVKLTDGTNLAGFIQDGAVYRQQVESKQASGSYSNVRIADSDGSVLADVLTDTKDNINRLQIKGKVSITAQQPPASATAVTISGDDPLDINSTQNEEYTIPNGETFTVTYMSSGAEGDPTEKGSKVELIYYDGTTEHLVERIYITGQTVPIYPDTSQARDGTVMVGNGSTKKIILRRIRLSGTGQEVDAVARGYVQ